jgi:Mrp family chromosome partitioning ATPase
VSFLLVTIPSEVARGVVARSVAALSKRDNRLLGYVENMSGYYCRDCNATKPLFASPDQPPPRLRRSAEASAKAEPLDLKIPCLGAVPFDPELARQCDRGLSLTESADTPVGRALQHLAQQLLDRLEPTPPGSPR